MLLRSVFFLILSYSAYSIESSGWLREVGMSYGASKYLGELVDAFSPALGSQISFRSIWLTALVRPELGAIVAHQSSQQDIIETSYTSMVLQAGGSVILPHNFVGRFAFGPSLIYWDQKAQFEKPFRVHDEFFWGYAMTLSLAQPVTERVLASVELNYHAVELTPRYSFASLQGGIAWQF